MKIVEGIGDAETTMPPVPTRIAMANEDKPFAVIGARTQQVRR